MNKFVFVDGMRIRCTLDDDFAVLHTHNHKISSYSPKFYIPEGEIWVDHRFRDETDFFMKLEEYPAPSAELSYDEIRARMKQELRLKGNPPNMVLKRTTTDEGLNICLVDGALVRQYLDPEFVFGGHHFVYNYIPLAEVWIDSAIDPREIPYIIEHELVERDHMSEGIHYDIAHEFATVADKKMRRADGFAYSGDANYPWRGLSNQEIIQQFYVVS